MSRARHEGERVVGTLPGKGVLGKVETLHVDTGIGALLTDPQTEQEIMRQAEQISQRAALPAGVRQSKQLI